jgi:hypothetical protein
MNGAPTFPTGPSSSSSAPPGQQHSLGAVDADADLNTASSSGDASETMSSAANGPSSPVDPTPDLAVAVSASPPKKPSAAGPRLPLPLPFPAPRFVVGDRVLASGYPYPGTIIRIDVRDCGADTGRGSTPLSSHSLPPSLSSSSPSSSPFAYLVLLDPEGCKRPPMTPTLYWYSEAQLQLTSLDWSGSAPPPTVVLHQPPSSSSAAGGAAAAGATSPSYSVPASATAPTAPQLPAVRRTATSSSSSSSHLPSLAAASSSSGDASTAAATVLGSLLHRPSAKVAGGGGGTAASFSSSFAPPSAAGPYILFADGGAAHIPSYIFEAPLPDYDGRWGGFPAAQQPQPQPQQQQQTRQRKRKAQPPPQPQRRHTTGYGHPTSSFADYESQVWGGVPSASSSARRGMDDGEGDGDDEADENGDGGDEEEEGAADDDEEEGDEEDADGEGEGESAAPPPAQRRGRGNVSRRRGRRPSTASGPARKRARPRNRWQVSSGPAEAVPAIVRRPTASSSSSSSSSAAARGSSFRGRGKNWRKGMTHAVLRKLYDGFGTPRESRVTSSSVGDEDGDADGEEEEGEDEEEGEGDGGEGRRGADDDGADADGEAADIDRDIGSPLSAVDDGEAPASARSRPPRPSFAPAPLDPGHTGPYRVPLLPASENARWPTFGPLAFPDWVDGGDGAASSSSSSSSSSAAAAASVPLPDLGAGGGHRPVRVGTEFTLYSGPFGAPHGLRVLDGGVVRAAAGGATYSTLGLAASMLAGRGGGGGGGGHAAEAWRVAVEAASADLGLNALALSVDPTPSSQCQPWVKDCAVGVVKVRGIWGEGRDGTPLPTAAVRSQPSHSPLTLSPLVHTHTLPGRRRARVPHR